MRIQRPQPILSKRQLPSLRTGIVWKAQLGALLSAFMLTLGITARAVGIASSTNILIAQLRYREVDYAPLYCEAKVRRDVRFSREPVYTGRQIFRGSLLVGQDTNQCLPFAWDMQGGKLYLDLNRNGNLTDDSTGMFTAPAKEVQLFKGIRRQFDSPSGPYEVLLDAHVFEQNGAVRVMLYVRSLWDGAVELGGRKWYLAVVDRPDGGIGPTADFGQIGDRMILRPWEDRMAPSLWWHATLSYVHEFSHIKLVDAPFRNAGNAEVFDSFNAPARLFLLGQAYQLEYRPEANGQLAVSFHTTSPPKGKLRLEGEHIRRVVLDGGASGYTAVLDSPGPDLTVPAGTYPRQIVLLQQKGGTNVAVGLGKETVTVKESDTARLTAGAPLHNSVGISREPRGGVVLFNYLLTNSAGLTFRLAFQDEKAPPSLEIRQDGRRLAAGRFRFG